MIVEFPSEGEKCDALLVDDDVVVQVVGETLKSMGHTSPWNQEQAEKLLAEKAYDYFLLDLAIPLYPKRASCPTVWAQSPPEDQRDAGSP